MASIILAGVPVDAFLHDRFARFARQVGAESSVFSAPFDEAFQKYCAEEYEGALHSPGHPATRRSYGALITDVLTLATDVQRGVRMEIAFSDPYPDFEAMFADVLANRRLQIRPSAKDGMPTDHPLAQPGTILGSLVNDDFRFIHDLCHCQTRSGFDARGEETAATFQASLVSTEAQPALCTETRLQNAEFWYGSALRDANGHVAQEGEPGYIPLGDRVFPPQRAFAAPLTCMSYDAWAGIAQQDRPATPASVHGCLSPMCGRNVSSHRRPRC